MTEKGRLEPQEISPLSDENFHKIKKESITTEDEDEKLEDIL